MAIFRVSHLSSFARWLDEDDTDPAWLVNQILSREETEAMRKGTAFHKCLEAASENEVDEVSADGYTFIFAKDFAVELPSLREWRQYKDYGGIIVTGKCDGLHGKWLRDDKTTERFDAEGYLTSWQHRFYMDIFEAERFTYCVWEMHAFTGSTYTVKDMHLLTQYRYPGMEQECRDLAQQFKVFADRYLPNYSFDPAQEAA
jgi:hypothetical protein